MNFLLGLLFLSSIFFAGCASQQTRNREKAEIYHQLALSSIESNELPAALRDLQAAEALDPNSAPIQNSLGLVYFLREKYELADSKFEKALSLAPSFTEARNNYSRNLIELKKYAKSEKESRKVLEDLTYNSPERAYINLGLSAFAQQKYSDAASHFRQSLAIVSDNCLGQTYYGRSLFELRKYPEASVALDKAIGFCQKQGNDEPNYYSALSYYRSGDKSRAMARLKEIVKLYPDGKNFEKATGMLSLIKGEVNEENR